MLFKKTALRRAVASTGASLLFGLAGLSSAETLVVPPQMQGATDLTMAFAPATSQGDKISFVLKAMNWEVYGGLLPEGREIMRLAGPSDAGEYDIIWTGENGELKGQTQMQVTPAEIWVNGPAVAKAGQGVLIEWSGPGFDGDSILLYRDADDMYLSEVKLKGDNPVLLPLEVEPGEYEVLYWYDATKSVMVREWLTVE